MAKKKHTQITVSQEENTQAQHTLEQYHELASKLRATTEQKQVEAALVEINNLPEGAQLALLKALSKELHTDAADILITLNECSPIKSVRKEARRSLIRLEGAKIYPQWKPPTQPTLLMQLTDVPQRLWKGVVFGTPSDGEVELLLFFENENDPDEIRFLGFLLDFLQDGIKDFFTRVESRRSAEKFLADVLADMPDVKTQNCSLAQARRLLLDALAVNRRYGTAPHKDYRYNLSLITRLILEAPGLENISPDEEILDEEADESINLHDLKPDAVVINFVESWVNGEYDLAYDLLSTDSPVREGLSKEEWIEQRDAWSDETDPRKLEPNFIHEREPQDSGLWLPNTVNAIRTATRKEIEVGWSIELEEPTLSDVPPELPKATVVYEETGRHWFWTKYTLIQDQGEWRIQDISDEGANILDLSFAELQKRLQEHDRFLDEFTKKHKPTSSESRQEFFDTIAWRAMQTVYYFDAFIKQLTFDPVVLKEAASRTLLFREYERCIVYLELMIERFPEDRTANLKKLASVQRDLSQKYFDRGDDEIGKRCLERAEDALLSSLAVEDDIDAHFSVAEVLIEMNERLDEAEDHLLQARAMSTDPADEAHIEFHLGDIAMEREQYEEALVHYQHFADHNPNSPNAWFNIAEAQSLLENFEEADLSYRRSISLQSENDEIYISLSQMYATNNQLSKAIEVLEEGLDANPESIPLVVSLATLHLENNDLRQVEILVERAERIDPDSGAIQMIRQMLNLIKREQDPYINRSNRPGLKRPKRKRH